MLPEDSEIDNTRIVLKGSEISTADDERMVESFKQHGRNKISILRSCQAVS